MKLLNEQYLQQRIEELENIKNKYTSPQAKQIADLAINELKKLVANCEEVEVEEITDDDLTHNSLEFLRNNGYKLIKTKL